MRWIVEANEGSFVASREVRVLGRRRHTEIDLLHLNEHHILPILAVSSGVQQRTHNPSVVGSSPARPTVWTRELVLIRVVSGLDERRCSLGLRTEVEHVAAEAEVTVDV